MPDLSHILGPDGRLADQIPGFTHRAQQQAMAERVAATLESSGVLICEAGTGTGKTFAYLVPALLSERKVVISTGTRNLQDQLFHRDLPLIRNALGVPVTAALLKGRSNYLCRHRLTLILADSARLDGETRGRLKQIRDWSTVTRRGDIAELPIPEDAAIWPEVTSTTDNCLGQDCPEFSDCHLVATRIWWWSTIISSAPIWRSRTRASAKSCPAPTVSSSTRPISSPRSQPASSVSV
jgi:ATP-dependent DNA helicase DinG